MGDHERKPRDPAEPDVEGADPDGTDEGPQPGPRHEADAVTQADAGLTGAEGPREQEEDEEEDR